MFLVLGFIIVGALQGIDRGDVADALSANATVGQILHETARTDDRKCCDDTKAAEEKPSICKPDCKAVIALGTLKPPQLVPDYGPRHQAAVASLGRTVDLRPPIS